MSMTDKISEVGQALQDYIEAGKDQLGLLDVWYGNDVGAVPQTPAVVIEPGTKSRSRSNTGHVTINQFVVDITIFHSRLESQRRYVSQNRDQRRDRHSGPQAFHCVVPAYCLTSKSRPPMFDLAALRVSAT